MSMRTPLGSVRGLGSAKAGSGHFIAQRATAIGLVPLLIYFVWTIAKLSSATYAEFAAWVSTPWGGGALILLVLAGFYHMALGLQVVIEDYFHKESTKIFLLLLNAFWAVAAGLVAVFSVLKIAFSS
ncbi:MAG: succinate dehydrogenase, hydrophobic membrane anchor protein [Parvularculaceae bacterium]